MNCGMCVTNSGAPSCDHVQMVASETPSQSTHHGKLTWCWTHADATYSMYLTDNLALCGTVPACMVSRLESLQGTSIIRPANASNPAGGYCASAAPSCSPNKGCRHAAQWAQRQGSVGCCGASLPATFDDGCDPVTVAARIGPWPSLLIFALRCAATHVTMHYAVLNRA